MFTGFKKILLLVFIWAIVPSFFVSAQTVPSPLSFSVTPSVLEITVAPSAEWASAVKIVNSGDKDITLYAKAVNILAKEKNGGSTFVPVIDDKENSSGLASWFDLSKEGVRIVVPKNGSSSLPFVLRVPQDAEPMTHHAAIIVGSVPLSGGSSGSLIEVSSFVSSVFSVNVTGQADARGFIREFSVDRAVFETTEISLLLKFENDGNIRLLPMGEVIIYNMWGKERGRLLIDENSGLGTVPPRSVKEASFAWKGENGFWDIGRYKAVAVLNFASEQRAKSEVSFWVLPLRSTMFILTGFLLFLGLASVVIKKYINKIAPPDITTK